MAVTAGTVWNSQTVANATSTAILPTKGVGVGVVVLRCDTGSAASLRINVRNSKDGQHTHPAYAVGDSSTYFVLAAGESIQFESRDDNRISQIYVDGNGGTSTFSGTVQMP